MIVKKKKKKKKQTKVIKKEEVSTHGNSKFDVKLLTTIKNLLGKGYNVSEVAELIGISEQTYFNWKTNYPSFFESEGKWKENAIEECVRTMVKLGKGYDLKETKVHWDKNGKRHTYDVVKQLPPNQKSLEFYLKNRDGKNWKDKVEHSIGEESKDFTLNYKQGDSKKKKPKK